MQKTYMGGCHCGQVRYEVDLELAQAISCNCSHCHKKGLLLAFSPAASFRTTVDESTLTEYRFNKKVIAHLFCSTCGVQSYGRGKDQSGNDTVAINIRCLDHVDTATIPVVPFNGKEY